MIIDFHTHVLACPWRIRKLRRDRHEPTMETDMTGMPSFAIAGASDDDIWSIVAFLKKLPSVSEADYKSWTATPPR